jgi:hypothetical protein
VDHESNSKIDLAIGAIALRPGSRNGIAFNPDCADEWACFVEAKLFSDSAYRTTNDPYRNQLERDIESLLCFQANGHFPQKLFFTILTPRKFKEKPRSRLYGYRIEEYQKDKSKVFQDLENFALPGRTNLGQIYPVLREHIDKLEIHWATYEQIFEIAYGVQSIDLLDRTGLGALEGKLDEAAQHLEEQLRELAVGAPDPLDVA